MTQETRADVTGGWSLEQGDVLDAYTIIKPLGRGGMAEVYLARDAELDREVALKLLLKEALWLDGAVERFEQEARTTACLNHPNIVTVHAVGALHDRPYVVLEYVEGESLRERLQAGTPGLSDALHIARAMAEGLAEAHRCGVVHLDLKPENVMLGRDGRLRLVDFGMSRSTGQDEGSRTLAPVPGPANRGPTQPGPGGSGPRLQGTPAYMAPEQWHQNETGGYTDLWALGVVMYELVLGQRPYEHHSSLRLAFDVCSKEQAPRVMDAPVPAALADLINHCLEKDPANRPSAREVARVLTALLEQPPCCPGQPGASSRVRWRGPARPPPATCPVLELALPRAV